MAIERSVTDIARNFADYVNRVTYRGERFVLMRGKRAVAELKPVPGGARLGELKDLLDGLPRLDSADAEKFEADIDETRAKLHPPADVWES